MAVDSIAAPPEPKRDAAARKLLPTVRTWSVVTLRQAYGAFPAGTVFRAAPASKPYQKRDGRLVTHYLTNNLTCDCPDYQQRGYVCKHVRAVILYEAELAASKPGRSYRELFGVCDDRSCDEDRLTNSRYCGRHFETGTAR